MKWTAEKPTESGAYWARPHKGRDRVVMLDVVSKKPSMYVVYDPHRPCATREDYSRFAGPIEEPQG